MVRKKGFGQIMEEADQPAFFKIVRREDLSSEITRMIPHPVIQSISGSSFKMDLKVPWGSSWTVKISKNPRFHYMEDHGWNQFVKDNALGENEYLTFTHEANMCFNVSIYRPDGTEILKAPKSATVASSSRRKKIDRDELKEETESSTELSYSGHKTAESTGRKLKQKREIKLGKKKVEQGQTSTMKVTNAANSSSRVPEFDVTIKKSYLLFLAIPKKVVAMHMPNKTTMFKIHHPKLKKPREVLYLVTNVQSRFSAGWAPLTKDLDLQVGDVCTFTLIKPSELLLKVTPKMVVLEV